MVAVLPAAHGALLAVLLRDRVDSGLGRALASPAVALAAMAALLVAVLVLDDIFAPGLAYGGFLAISLVTALVVGHTYMGSRGPVLAVLGSPVIVWLGQRSYGIYLYHYPLVVTLRAMPVSDAWHAPLSLLGAVVLAGASFKYLETPLRERGRSTTARRGAAAALSVDGGDAGPPPGSAVAAVERGDKLIEPPDPARS